MPLPYVVVYHSRIQCLIAPFDDVANDHLDAALPFSPVCACGGLPQPRSSRAHAAATRADSLVPSLAMPANTLIAIFVWERAKELISVGALAI